MTNYGRLPSIDLAGADRIREPSGSGEGHWVGAPCALVRDGTVYLAVRWRNPTDRGHTVSILERTDGSSYREVVSITASSLGVESVERPALLADPRTDALKLYLPVDRGENDWSIRKLDDVRTPGAFDPETARDVLAPEPGTTDAVTVKDPCVVTLGGRYYLFYAGHDGRSEQAHLATSVDGETWTRSPANPVLPRGSWHDHHTRISCVLPARDGPFWHVFYDGSGTADYGNTWNLRTGHAVSFDLQTVVDTAPDGPWLSSPRDGADRFRTCRYIDVVTHGDEWEVFAEVARQDGSFDLRRAVVDAP